MPGLTVGVYERELAAGTEVSSTYEGRHVTVLESEIIHPFRASTFVNKGDPVLLCRTAVPGTYGSAVGVAFATATAATDFIAIDTEGIFNLPVAAFDDLGNNMGIEIGDPLYIHDASTGAASVNGSGDGELSPRNNLATQRHFGYALGRMAGGSTGQIAVKVHFDPPELNAGEMIYKTVGAGEYGYGIWNIITDLASDAGIAGQHNTVIYGTPAGNCYGWKSWLYLMSGAVAGADIMTPLDTGIYSVDAQATLRGYFAGQHQAILIDQPTNLHAWRLNTTHAITALIHAANYGSVGYIHGVAGSAVVGVIPLVNQVESAIGVCYVDVHQAYA